MWRVFSTGLKEIMVKIWHFHQKSKWDYSLRTRKKKFNMQWLVLISFSLSISFFSFYISLFLCTSYFKIIVWDEKIRHCVGGCYIQWGFFNQWLFMTFFSHCKLLRFTSSFNAFFVFVQICRLRLLLFGRYLRHLQASFEMYLCAFRLTKR